MPSGSGRRVVRDNEYHSNWGKNNGGALPIKLRGLQLPEENSLSKSGYHALAATPRFQNIMAHETTAIEKAAADSLRQPETGPKAPPAVKVIGQGQMAVDSRGEADYMVFPNATRAMLTGRKNVPPIRISVGQVMAEPVHRGPHYISGRHTARYVRHPVRPPRTAPATARSASSPRSRNRRNARKHPMIDTPHRVYAPPFMNAPMRVDFQKGATGSPRSAGQKERSNRRANQEKIQDYVFRATACKRAGRRRAEANAYYSMGVLYDSNREYLKAVECYEAFKDVLVATEDKFAQALAHNSIGVSYMNLGGPGSIEAAIEHHKRHRDLADIPGKFIAFTNLGLLYNRIGDFKAAAVHHQHALRCAIRMSSVAGQSVAIGNLGLAGLANNDLASARVCLERHLELTRQLGDVEGESAALQKLGEIANKQGQYQDAADNFSDAWKTANQTGDAQMANVSKVNLGVARATVSMDEHLKRMGNTMRGESAQ